MKNEGCGEIDAQTDRVFAGVFTAGVYDHGDLCGDVSGAGYRGTGAVCSDRTDDAGADTEVNINLEGGEPAPVEADE